MEKQFKIFKVAFLRLLQQFMPYHPEIEKGLEVLVLAELDDLNNWKRYKRRQQRHKDITYEVIDL